MISKLVNQNVRKERGTWHPFIDSLGGKIGRFDATVTMPTSIFKAHMFDDLQLCGYDIKLLTDHLLNLY